MSTPSKVTISDWLDSSTRLLSKSGILTSRLDCLVLLEDLLQTDRSSLLAHSENILTPEQINVLNSQLKKRTDNNPLAYIRGKVEFYGRIFKVNNSVLVPRPESEAIIDELKKLPPAKKSLIVDIGTGSGILGITAALELANSKVELYDISSAALATAKINVKLHKLNLPIIQSNLLSEVHSNPEIVIANLPYVPDIYEVSNDVSKEPKIAIFGGFDGLDLYRELWSSILKQPIKPSNIIIESLPNQHEVQEKLAGAAGYLIKNECDFVQVFEINRL